MILAIDAGNTRIKWGLWEDRGFLAQGSVLTAHASELADALHMLARPRIAIGASVAGAAVRTQLEQVLAPWGVVDQSFLCNFSIAACGELPIMRLHRHGGCESLHTNSRFG